MEQYFPFQSSPLPYSYVALMPRCDANTLYYHHDDFYAKAVYELNNLVVRHRLTQLSLRQLLSEDINLPTAQLDRLRNAAGAVYSHQLYFDGISCKAGQPPFNRLTEAIVTTYGSMPAFQQLLREAADRAAASRSPGPVKSRAWERAPRAAAARIREKTGSGFAGAMAGLLSPRRGCAF